MAGSILVAVRSALVAGLSELAGVTQPFDGAQLSYQWKPDWQAREKIYTRNGRVDHAAASLRAGRNYRDETGTFEVVVVVEGVGKTQEWTSTRALELGLGVEEYVADRKNNELGITGLQTLQVAGSAVLGEMFNDAGHLAEFALPIRYTARLT